MQGFGAPTLLAVKNLYNFIVVLLYMVLHPWVQQTSDYEVLSYIFIEKNPHVSGLIQFKFIVGQLYLWYITLHILNFL